MSLELAHRDVSLRVTALVGIGGIADMNGRVASAELQRCEKHDSLQRSF